MSSKSKYLNKLSSSSGMNSDRSNNLPERRLYCLRVAVLLSLAVTAALVGSGAYLQSASYESQMEKSEFNSIATHFASSVIENLKSKVWALESHSNVLAFACPRAENWPNCTIPYNLYLNITRPSIASTKMRAVSFGVLITPDQVNGFEEFAYDFYASQGYAHYGISSFGRGVWAVDPVTFERVHSTQPPAYAKYNVLMPLLHCPTPESESPVEPPLMYNAYDEHIRVNAAEYMLDCYNASDKSVSAHKACTSISDVIQLIEDTEFNPAVFLSYPVTDRNDFRTVRGVAHAVFNWDSVFIYALPRYVCALDIVLAGRSEEYTFRICNGRVEKVTVGDRHEAAYSSRRHFFELQHFTGEIQYTVTLYPTARYEESFTTERPWWAMALSVGIVLFTSLVFGLYDLAMNRSAIEKELRMNIDTKRLFVRFISHEIRTPLNTVHVGLKLLTNEMSTFAAAAQMADNTQATGTASRIEDWVGVIRDIEDSSDCAIVVLNDLLNYDKISMGTLNAEFEVVSLWSLVRAAVKPFHVQARRSGIRIDIELEVERTDLPKERRAHMRKLVVIADGIKLGQVVRNLLSNALKFSKEGDTITVKVCWDEKGLSQAKIPSEFGQLVRNENAPRTRRSIFGTVRGAAPIAPQAQTEAGAGGLSPLALEGGTAYTGGSVGGSEGEKYTFSRAGSLIVTVADCGAGISKHNQTNLFREGVQFDANKLQAGQGSGLGLWISSGIIAMHAGKLTAHSEGEGLGSEFRVELPSLLPDHPLPESLSTPESHASEVGALGSVSRGVPSVIATYSFQGENHQQQQSLLQEPSPSPTGSGGVGALERPPAQEAPPPQTGTPLLDDIAHHDAVRTVMVVDDSAPTRKVLARLLRNAGYAILEAVDGQDCVDQIVTLHNSIEGGDEEDGGGDISWGVDLILMDYEMPRLNGPAATAKLRKMGLTIPIIGVTGNVLPVDKEFFIAQGASSVLHKPLSIDQLRVAMSMLNSSAASRCAAPGTCSVAVVGAGAGAGVGSTSASAGYPAQAYSASAAEQV